MAFCQNYKISLSHFDLARYEEKVKMCGLDPYELKEVDCLTDPNMWPSITEIDRIDYFVPNTNFVSKQAMKNKKSLEPYNFLISGHVLHRLVKVSSEYVLVLGKVKHTQCSSLESVKAWLLVHTDGEILTGHCTCMAGRGETCSHVGAIAFLIEYGVQVRDGTACTGAVNQWLPSKLKKVPFKKAEEMDFRSPAARLPELCSDPSHSGGRNTVRSDNVTALATKNVRKPTKEAFSTRWSLCSLLCRHSR